MNAVSIVDLDFLLIHPCLICFAMICYLFHLSKAIFGF